MRSESNMVSAEDLIDRNRRLLARAEAARAYKRLVVEEMAENRLRLHLTLVRTVHLHYGRTGFLSEMIYLRRLIAEHMITHHTALISVSAPDHGAPPCRLA